MSLERFVLRMPKVELHVHLEGAMRPAVLLELARRNGIDLPARDEAGLKRWFRFRDFEQFVKIYLTCSSALRNPEDFELLALDFLAEQAYQKVVYSEVHFTIGTHVAAGRDGEAIRQALAAAMAEGERRYGVEMRLIPDIVRNVGPALADTTLEWALAGRESGVVALGLSGSEARFGNEPFARHFQAAEAAGLHRVAHAGEHAGPESIRSALELCHPERIGHGVRAVEDPGLVAELARRQMPLEVCPGSNVALGVYPTLAAHSFDRLRRAGVPLSVNTDDPAFFGTNLTREYLRLHATWGYGPAELAGFSLAALRQSFLPAERKAEMERDFRARFGSLGQDVFGAPVDPA
ncbi:MAG TPA: adenosine deaminase [Thermoanaerobaculia bacterium]|jgi:adenosine deaminase|nr:adenosine deaminase [Thermoanaerobaculia bacterium]